MVEIANEITVRVKGGAKGKFPNIFITSDTHWNHKNICVGTTDWRTPEGGIPLNSVRPFGTLEQMNEKILHGINSKVGQDDILFLLGDVAFGGAEFVKNFLDRIICKNLYLVFGNHDDELLDDVIVNNELNLRSYFKGVFGSYVRLRIGKQVFILSHYPIVSWHGLNKGWMHLFGHVHLPAHRKFGPGKCMDVGVDGSDNYTPYNIMTECVPLLEKREIKSWLPFDHHTK